MSTPVKEVGRASSLEKAIARAAEVYASLKPFTVLFIHNGGFFREWVTCENQFQAQRVATSQAKAKGYWKKDYNTDMHQTITLEGHVRVL